MLYTYLTARHVGGETLSFVQVIFMLNVQSIYSIITFYVRNVEIFFYLWLTKTEKNNLF